MEKRKYIPNEDLGSLLDVEKPRFQRKPPLKRNPEKKKRPNRCRNNRYCHKKLHNLHEYVIENEEENESSGSEMEFKIPRPDKNVNLSGISFQTFTPPFDSPVVKIPDPFKPQYDVRRFSSYEFKRSPPRTPPKVLTRQERQQMYAEKISKGENFSCIVEEAKDDLSFANRYPDYLGLNYNIFSFHNPCFPPQENLKPKPKLEENFMPSNLKQEPPGIKKEETVNMKQFSASIIERAFKIIDSPNNSDDFKLIYPPNYKTVIAKHDEYEFPPWRVREEGFSSARTSENASSFETARSTTGTSKSNENYQEPLDDEPYYLLDEVDRQELFGEGFNPHLNLPPSMEKGRDIHSTDKLKPRKEKLDTPENDLREICVTDEYNGIIEMLQEMTVDNALTNVNPITKFETAEDYFKSEKKFQEHCDQLEMYNLSLIELEKTKKYKVFPSAEEKLQVFFQNEWNKFESSPSSTSLNSDVLSNPPFGYEDCESQIPGSKPINWININAEQEIGRPVVVFDARDLNPHYKLKPLWIDPDFDFEAPINYVNNYFLHIEFDSMEELAIFQECLKEEKAIARANRRACKFNVKNIISQRKPRKNKPPRKEDLPPANKEDEIPFEIEIVQFIAPEEKPDYDIKHGNLYSKPSKTTTSTLTSILEEPEPGDEKEEDQIKEFITEPELILPLPISIPETEQESEQDPETPDSIPSIIKPLIVERSPVSFAKIRSLPLPVEPFVETYASKLKKSLRVPDLQIERNLVRTPIPKMIFVTSEPSSLVKTNLRQARNNTGHKQHPRRVFWRSDVKNKKDVDKVTPEKNKSSKDLKISLKEDQISNDIEIVQIKERETSLEFENKQEIIYFKPCETSTSTITTISEETEPPREEIIEAIIEEVIPDTELISSLTIPIDEIEPELLQDSENPDAHPSIIEPILVERSTSPSPSVAEEPLPPFEVGSSIETYASKLKKALKAPVSLIMFQGPRNVK